MPKKTKTKKVVSQKQKQRQSQNVVVNIGNSQRRRNRASAPAPKQPPAPAIQYIPFHTNTVIQQPSQFNDNGLLSARVRMLEEGIRNAPPIINTATTTPPLPTAPISAPISTPAPVPVREFFENEKEIPLQPPKIFKEMNPPPPDRGYDFSPQKQFNTPKKYEDEDESESDYYIPPYFPSKPKDETPKKEETPLPIIRRPKKKQTPLLDRPHFERSRSDNERHPVAPPPRGDMRAMSEQEKRERKSVYDRERYLKRLAREKEQREREQSGED